jgi:hypothetical protein
MWKTLLFLFLLLVSPVATIPLHAQACSELHTRPELSGEELTRETDSLIIHYTAEGPDAASEEHIDYLQETLEYVLAVQADELGWPLPLADCGEGGDQRYDIYVLDTLREGNIGYATAEATVNEEGGGLSESAAYGYLAIDNDFAGTDDPDRLLRAVVAHEVFHSIQFTFDAAEPADWYSEATAVWMANATYPDVEDLGSFVDVLSTPELCLGFESEEEALSSRVYGEWVYFETLVNEVGGDPAIVLDLWHNITLSNDMKPLYVTLEAYGLAPTDIILHYAVRNLLFDYAAGQAMVATGERVREESSAITGIGEYTPDSEGVQQLGVNYVPISEPGMYSFWLDDESLSLAVVGVNTADSTAHVYVPNNGESVDTSAHDYAYLLVLNPAMHTSNDECAYTPWVLTVEDGDPDNLAGLIEAVFDASNFSADAE